MEMLTFLKLISLSPFSISQAVVTLSSIHLLHLIYIPIFHFTSELTILYGKKDISYFRDNFNAIFSLVCEISKQSICPQFDLLFGKCISLPSSILVLYFLIFRTWQMQLVPLELAAINFIALACVIQDVGAKLSADCTPEDRLYVLQQIINLRELTGKITEHFSLVITLHILVGLLDLVQFFVSFFSTHYTLTVSDLIDTSVDAGIVVLTIVLLAELDAQICKIYALCHIKL